MENLTQSHITPSKSLCPRDVYFSECKLPVGMMAAIEIAD
jgi:hypothetical protein